MIRRPKNRAEYSIAVSDEAAIKETGFPEKPSFLSAILFEEKQVDVFGRGVSQERQPPPELGSDERPLGHPLLGDQPDAMAAGDGVIDERRHGLGRRDDRVDVGSEWPPREIVPAVVVVEWDLVMHG